MKPVTATRQAEATKHRSVPVDGLDIFYREAGDPANPTLLLLRRFPTSSQTFRNLVPKRSDRTGLVGLVALPAEQFVAAGQWAPQSGSAQSSAQ